jgi:hypothetical protein
MILSELLLRKKHIRTRIDELKAHLKYENVVDINKIIDKILELEDRFQKYVLIIDKINAGYEVTVGNNKVSVATAIRLRETTRRKIKVLDGAINNTRMKIGLIDNTKPEIDILDLMKQRSTLWEELIIYDRAININDWRTNVD